MSDRADPLAAFLHGDVWAEEAVPAFRRELRKLERAAIAAPSVEKLRDLQAQHALIRRFAAPDRLLAFLRAKPGVFAGDDEPDDPQGPGEDPD